MEIGGGKFANGAITGAFAVMFNDIVHDIYMHKLEKRGFLIMGRSENEIRKRAFKYMILKSKEKNHEIAAAILENGMIYIFRDMNNDENEAQMPGLYESKGNLYVKLRGRNGKYHINKVQDIVHTHSGVYGSGFDNYLCISHSDEHIASYFNNRIYVLWVDDGCLYKVITPGTSSQRIFYHKKIDW